jgi:CheY-like chemotaxis protein
MAGERLLVVEDDPMILDALGYSLAQEGFQVLRTTDGREVARIRANLRRASGTMAEHAPVGLLGSRRR